MNDLFAIMTVVRRQWPWMAGGIALGMLVIAANTLLMAVSGWFIASMAIAGVTGMEFNYFIPSAAIRGLAITRTVGRYLERLITHEAAFRALAELRVWLFKRLEPLAPAGLERFAGGDVAGRLRADVDSLESLYLRIVAPLVTGTMSMLLAVIFITFWSKSSAMALLLSLLVTGVIIPLTGRFLSEEPGKQVTVVAGTLRTTVTEGFQGLEEVILLGAKVHHTEQVKLLSSRLIAEQVRLGVINSMSVAGSICCSGLGIAVILLSVSMALSESAISGPALVMLLLFAAAAFETTATLPGALQQIPATIESIRRIRELSEAAPPVPEPPQPMATLPQATGISFRNVTCSYTPDMTALCGFNLDIIQGKSVALTGPSGIGKSTVMEILLRFRDFSGLVTVGGMDIRALDSDSLRSLIAAVPQHPHLFNCTIRENILLGKPEATAAEIETALENAGLTRWVDGLPLGLETSVGIAGGAVSGGEARRIALARALLKDAPILLLDEPTEGLDSATELAVVHHLQQQARSGKTILLISHRPACLTMVDQVVHLS
jgi:ATP-binding cassette subfamily C protein CydC